MFEITSAKKDERNDPKRARKRKKKAINVKERDRDKDIMINRYREVEQLREIERGKEKRERIKDEETVYFN